MDCRWPEHHLTAELDSFAFHNSRKSWEESYQREREARSRGDEFRRFTWLDIAEDQTWMLSELLKFFHARDDLGRDAAVPREHVVDPLARGRASSSRRNSRTGSTALGGAYWRWGGRISGVESAHAARSATLNESPTR